MTYIDTHKTAVYLGVSEANLAQRRWQGRGPAYIKVGRKVLYSTNDLDAFMAACRVETRDFPDSAADRQAAE